MFLQKKWGALDSRTIINYIRVKQVEIRVISICFCYIYIEVMEKDFAERLVYEENRKLKIYSQTGIMDLILQKKR